MTIPPSELEVAVGFQRSCSTAFHDLNDGKVADMDHAEAASFARRWADNWNSKDLEGLLDHFSDEVVFTSPIAARVIPGSGGVLLGKEAVRRYWGEGLRRIPELHFELEAVYAGVSTVVINYRNHTGALVCEVLRFEGQLVVEGHGTYLTNNAAGASGVVSEDGDATGSSS